MKQQRLFESIPCDKYDLLSRDDLVTLAKGYEDAIKQLQVKLEKQTNEILKTEQTHFLLNEQVINIKNKLFGKSSEKSPTKSQGDKVKKQPRQRVLLPSERYPDVDIIEKRVELKKIPDCPCCNKEMKDSGLTEDSEYLTSIPRRFFVVKQMRVKYRCGTCQEGLVTAPGIPRIKAGSSLSDEMVVDVALSKYCDLIPVERYVQMAARSGVHGLPANTLIQGTHNLSDFLRPVYYKIKDEILNSKILHADETPHRMLEGDEKSHWYLWGFSTNTASYFECHDTRSGDVASNIIKDSKCEYLMSDIFSGYSKAVTESNIYRQENQLTLIRNIYCNAHARRKFKESGLTFEEENRLFIWCYQKIYQLQENKNAKNRRDWQLLYYKAMEKFCLKIRTSYSAKSSLIKAINYFLKNFYELTFFINYDELPIDNNSQERLMRNPVIGRKTWYGTHSRRGAQTNAILFSLVESCKINKINPREYFKDIVHAMLEKRAAFTPYEYLQMKSAKTA